MAWGYWSATSVQPDRRSPRRGTTVAQQLPVAAAPTPSLHQAQTAPQPQGSQVPQAPQGARACSSSSSSSAEGPLAAMAAAAAPSGAEPIRAARRPSLDLYGSHMDPLGSMSMPMERAGGLPLCSSAPHAHQMQGPQGVPHYRNVPWASTTAVHLDDGHDEELVINHSYCPRLDHRHPGQGHGPGPGHGHSHSHLHGLLAGPGQGMQGHGQGHGHGGQGTLPAVPSSAPLLHMSMHVQARGVQGKPMDRDLGSCGRTTTLGRRASKRAKLIRGTGQFAAGHEPRECHTLVAGCGTLACHGRTAPACPGLRCATLKGPPT